MCSSRETGRDATDRPGGSDTRASGLLVLLAALGALAVCPATTASEVDLGVIGPVYPVIEPDMLRAIEARLREKARTGELARLEREGIARAERTLNEPRPVEGSRARRPTVCATSTRACASTARSGRPMVRASCPQART